jgi:hypothetical protein
MTPRITLCMIVRDEERFLAGCLASVRGAVDEIVVVDTGSNDNTRQIALDAGARVVDHVWEHDFAAARNAALPHVTTEWILVLDADERLAPGAAPVLRAAAAAGGFVVGMLPLHNATRMDATPLDILSGRERLGEVMLLPRLILRLPDLAWTGRVHETVADWLLAHGAVTQAVHAHLLHYGYVKSLVNDRDKIARNLKLLEAECEANPDNAPKWGYLAFERQRAGDIDGHDAAIAKGWAALARAKARGEWPSVVPLASSRGIRQLQRGELEQVLDTVTLARTWATDHPNLCWLAGTALELLGRDGTREFWRAIDWQAATTEDTIVGARTWRSRASLAAAILSRNPPEALGLAQAALDEQPSDEHRLLVAEALCENGRHADALAVLEPMMAEDDPKPWVIAALAALGLGDLETAATLTTRIKGDLPPQLHRRCQTLFPEIAFRRGQPIAGGGPWGTLGAIVGGLPLTSPAAVSLPTLREAAIVLGEQGDELGLESLMSARAEALVPGARQVVLDLLAAAGLQWNDDADDFVFVDGAPGCGAAEVRAMLGAHPHLWSTPRFDRYEEPTALAAAAAGQAHGQAIDREALWRLMHDGVPQGRRPVVPMPVRHASWMAGLFQRARYIHVIRDGRRAVTAVGDADVTALAERWAADTVAGRRHGQVFPNRYLEIRYEDVMSDPKAALTRLLAFLGEPWDDAVLAAPAGPDTTASAAAIAAVEGHAADVLTDLGYHLTDACHSGRPPPPA